MDRAKTIVVLSGGMDSTALLYELLAAGDAVYALTVNYGQRHAREIAAACDVISHWRKMNPKSLGIVEQHAIVDISAIKQLLGASSQTNNEIKVPHGHYAEESMKQTVVPNRNMILLSIAAGWAITVGAKSIAYAAHAGDHAIYPDCRPEFVVALTTALAKGNYEVPAVYAPFIGMTKGGIVIQGDKLSVPWVLTWSCYEGKDVHCGECGTCVERREAFASACIVDPTEYGVGGRGRNRPKVGGH